jgi:NAD(P)H-dependent FMN reductase
MEAYPMRVLTVYAHPNPKSFCHAILEQFTKGLAEAGHTSEVVDLYAIRAGKTRSDGLLSRNLCPRGH